MAHGEFVWTDLSARQPAQAERFYGAVFGWTFAPTAQPDGSAYAIASVASGPVAGVFEMPAKFQQMGLPSFWMPYFQVDDLDRACESGVQGGGKLELGPTDWSKGDRIALLRDPLGAGFTLYEGKGLTADWASRRLSQANGLGCALYVSDPAAVTVFYEHVLGWQISGASALDGSLVASSRAGDPVAHIVPLTDALRGGYEFWGVHFPVEDLATATRAIKAAGGSIDYQDAEGPLTLAKDLDGAAFFLVPSTAPGSARAPTREGRANPGAKKPALKWKTLLGLALIYAAVVFEQNWVWGLLFLLWTVPALRSGETFFVEPINRRSNPWTYWALIITWIGLSALLIAVDLWPSLA
ncbi:MAG: VOC family protein [Pseudomonadota bacterium]